MPKIDFDTCRHTLRQIQHRLGGAGFLVSMGWDGEILRITAAQPTSGALPFTMVLDGAEDYSTDPEILLSEFMSRAQQHFTPGGLTTYRAN